MIHNTIKTSTEASMKPHECFGRLEKDKMPWNFAVISGVSEVRLMGKEHQRMKMLDCSSELQPTPWALQTDKKCSHAL